MRRTTKLLAAAVIAALAGCGSRTGPAGGPGSATPVPVVAPAGPAVPVAYMPLVRGYGDNRLAADAAYKGKVVRTAFTVDEIGADRGGAFLGGSDIAGSTEPTIVCYLADPTDPLALGLRKDQFCTVEGVVEGRVDDGKGRGVAGREYHVRLTNCRVLETGPTYESLKKAPPFSP